MIVRKKKVEFFVSNKADNLTARVQKRIDELYAEHSTLEIEAPIMPSISYANNGKTMVYMIACSLNYYILEEIEDGIDDIEDSDYSIGLDFGIGDISNSQA